MHNNVLPDEYARVEVLSVSLNHLNYEVEIPSPNGEMVLGNLVGYFIAMMRHCVVNHPVGCTFCFASATIASGRGTSKKRPHGRSLYAVVTDI